MRTVAPLAPLIASALVLVCAVATAVALPLRDHLEQQRACGAADGPARDDDALAHQRAARTLAELASLVHAEREHPALVEAVDDAAEAAGATVVSFREASDAAALCGFARDRASVTAIARTLEPRGIDVVDVAGDGWCARSAPPDSAAFVASLR